VTLSRKSFSFDTTAEIIGNVQANAFCPMYKHILAPMCYIFEVWEIDRFHAAEVTFKVTQGH